MVWIARSCVLVALSLMIPVGASAGPRALEPVDVFNLERAVDPRISPDGERIVYVRSGYDVLTDRSVGTLWVINADGSGHQPLVDIEGASSPRWSPTGDRLAFVASRDGRSQIFMHWLDSGRTAPITRLTQSPGRLTWSPDGEMLAFTMFVPKEGAPAAAVPKAPEGADWGPPIEVVDRLRYRADGHGALDTGHTHVFVIPAEGGTPRRLTDGDFDHESPLSWSPDARTLYLSANRREDWETEPLDTEIFALDIATRELTRLTDRRGPDNAPAVSPDGLRIAYTGFDDRYQGFQAELLYVMNADGSGVRVVTEGLDREVSDPTWSADGRSVLVQYTVDGRTRIGSVPAGGGEVRELVSDLGGLSVGRPYGGGSFTLADNGRIAFTIASPDRPADLAVLDRASRNVRTITDLNADALDHVDLGEVNEFWTQAPDGLRVQGWYVTPPGFDPDASYPLILEIHGGPFANYGPRFAAEVQLFASAGYVVCYANPRGSTSYGEDFANAIHHAYPGEDYDDLMACVDHMVGLGFIDEDRLFVTGGSGGGVLTAWIVGKTDRFRAAAVQKPVINWYSFVLYADVPAYFWRYWFPGPPWEHEGHYMDRSPISLVGNVSTPTMLITGEQDFRTPMPETEQYYTALKIRGVPTKMVRVPDAAHGIASKPSNLIAKVAEVLAWFEEHGE